MLGRAGLHHSQGGESLKADQDSLKMRPPSLFLVKGTRTSDISGKPVGLGGLPLSPRQCFLPQISPNLVRVLVF